jgi:hypothetical protein
MVRPRQVKRRWPAVLVVGAMVLVVTVGSMARQMCISTWMEHGLRVPVCPDGKIRQTVQLRASALRRGAEGLVVLAARAHYTVAAADEARSASIEVSSAALSLVDPHGKETPLSPPSPFKKGGAPGSGASPEELMGFV